MPKALMVNAYQIVNPGDVSTHYQLPAGGNGVAGAAEGRHQLQHLVAADISELRVGRTVAGSGNVTVTTRKNGVATAQVDVFDGSVTGAYVGSGSSSFAANDLYSLSTSDSGTMPTIAWFGHLIELGSGYGGYYGTDTCNVNWSGATRYVPPFGAASVSSISARIAARIRGFTHVKGIHTAVTANTRTTPTTVRVVVNGVTQDSHVLAAGVTGNFSKALDIPLSDGDDLRLEVDGGVDVTSMTIARMHLLMTSDTNEVDLGGYGATNFSTTPQYVHLGGVATSSSASATGRGVPIGYSGEIRNPRLYVASTGGNTVTANLKKNGVTALTVTGVAADGWIENTVDTVGFGPTDEFYWEVYTSSGTATVQQMFATVSNVQVSRFADGTSSGEAEGDAVGRADTAATGTSSGSGQASAAAIVFEPAVGEAEGAATVAGFGYGRVNTVGIADTGAFAQGAGSTIGIINGAGLSFGSAQVDGHGESGAAAQGIALASARAAAAAKQVGWRRGRRLSGSWTKQGADI